MNPIVDGIMLVLFVLFMVFIFGGYHKNKSAQREEQFKREKEEQDKLNSKN
jgi:uncharacterized membrane protein